MNRSIIIRNLSKYIPTKNKTWSYQNGFYRVPYHEQYESRDNESKNWNAQCIHELYSSLDLRVLDEERRTNMELFILRLKSTKVRANKKIANESDGQ